MNTTKQYLVNVIDATRQLVKHLLDKVPLNAKMSIIKYTLLTTFSCALTFTFAIELIVVLSTVYNPTPSNFMCCSFIPFILLTHYGQARQLRDICYYAYKKILHVELTETEKEMSIIEAISSKIEKKYRVRTFHWLYIAVPLVLLTLLECTSSHLLYSIISSIIVCMAIFWVIIIIVSGIPISISIAKN